MRTSTWAAALLVGLPMFFVVGLGGMVGAGMLVLGGSVPLTTGLPRLMLYDVTL